jgi:hypothetical protein
MSRTQFGGNDAAKSTFIKLSIDDILVDYASISLERVSQLISSYGVGQKCVEDLNRMDCIDLWFETRFDLEPCLFEQARPHIAKFDRFGKQGFFSMTKDVIINEKHLTSMIIDNLQCVDAVTVTMSQNNSVDQFWICWEVAQKHSEVLQDLI